MYAIDVSTSDNQRFQVSALSHDIGLDRPGNIMIKAVQGISSGVGNQVDDNATYKRVYNLPAISHYTQISCIDDFIGFYGKGIVPGGIHK